jgi:hypothetical protein
MFVALLIGGGAFVTDDLHIGWRRGRTGIGRGGVGGERTEGGVGGEFGFGFVGLARGSVGIAGVEADAADDEKDDGEEYFDIPTAPLFDEAMAEVEEEMEEDGGRG